MRRARSGETRVEEGPNRLDTMVYDVNFGQVDIDWARQSFTMMLRGDTGQTIQTLTVPFRDLQISN
ncbi:MAG: hypothetical protein AAGA69_03235 [Pseudomonadota bacterium]